MRGVELNVFAAALHELVDLLAKDFPCQSPHRNVTAQITEACRIFVRRLATEWVA